MVLVALIASPGPYVWFSAGPKQPAAEQLPIPLGGPDTD
jgi:hypothetical protein